MIIFKTWIFNLSDINQGIPKHVIPKEIGVFSVFEKKIYPAKSKKNIISESRTTLSTQKINFVFT